MMNFANYSIDGKMMNVIDSEEYFTNQSIYANGNVAIKSEKNGVDYYLPVRAQIEDGRPGAVTGGSNCVLFMQYPEKGDTKYSNKDNLVDFHNVDNMRDIMERQNQYKDLEYEMLCSPDDIFIAPLLPNDTPAMRGLKEAINAKHMDLDKYKDRFGVNYPNDRRKFKENDATLKMIDRIATNTDIEVTMTFRDKNPNVANPIGREITVLITGETNKDEGEQ